MSLILNIETATTLCSLALSEPNGKLLSVRENHDQQSHANQITILIGELLADSGKSVGDLAAVAVSSGPGSYTGLRVGLSAAKGLCFSLNIPLISVDTLSALATAIDHKENPGLYCPMIDARRMEVYTALFNTDQLIKEPQAVVVDDTFLSKELAAGKVYFFGDGSDKCRKVINHPNAAFIPDIQNSAKYMISFSSQKFKALDFVDTAYYTPFYLKNQYVSSQK